MPTAGIFGASETPANVTVGDLTAITIGLRFIPAIDGTITGVRYWRSQTTAGQQTVALWSVNVAGNTGTLLASRAVTGETASGWQTQLFTTPIAVTAGTVYCAGCFMGAGGYAATTQYFLFAGRHQPLGLLYTPGIGSTSGCGWFTAGGSLTFPSTFFGNNNYWVEPSFFTAKTPETLFADTPSPAPATISNDAAHLELGTRIKVSRSGICYGVRRWVPTINTDPGGQNVSGTLYGPAGTILKSVLTPNPPNRPGPNWHCFIFNPPVSLAFGSTYTIGLQWDATGEDYGWTASAFGMPLVSGTITALATSDGGNGLYGPFNTGNPNATAPSTNSGANYFNDLMFIPDDVVAGAAKPIITFLAT